MADDTRNPKLQDPNARVAELRGGDNLFPIAVTVAKLDAYGVARRLSETAKHTFGIERRHLAARLRELAALLDESKIIPQRVSFETSALVEEFTTTTLTFTFAEQTVPIVEEPPRALGAR
jgi:enoyl-[acyl-carrier-protein] reductase (NADH)